MTVADNEEWSNFGHRVVDDETWVLDFAGVRRFREHTAILGTHHSVAAVCASPHHSVDLDHVLARLVHTEDDNAARVGVCCESLEVCLRNCALHLRIHLLLLL